MGTSHRQLDLHEIFHVLPFLDKFSHFSQTPRDTPNFFIAGIPVLSLSAANQISPALRFTSHFLFTDLFPLLFSNSTSAPLRNLVSVDESCFLMLVTQLKVVVMFSKFTVYL